MVAALFRYNMWVVVRLALQLRGNNYIEELTTGWGKAAHYLSKRENKIKRPEDDDKPGEMKPDDFPEELKNILWQDAFGTSVYKALPLIADDSIM
ncbi:hypothetical protein C5167_012739 [Papaver somniferum]|uniref:Uncharacterized protein n=1 Tax=Papaver somniferum TaxID=3469 RepID=A0A4Y7IYA5_PAPSO|nr:hypothetical protein C5167_012739 [Papaver somniferum]